MISSPFDHHHTRNPPRNLPGGSVVLDAAEPVRFHAQAVQTRQMNSLALDQREVWRDGSKVPRVDGNTMLHPAVEPVVAHAGLVEPETSVVAVVGTGAVVVAAALGSA